MNNIDTTHRADLRSWVVSANGHEDFPIQNLPFGVFSRDGGAPRGGVAIGDQILDLLAVSESGLLHGEAQQGCILAAGRDLNAFMARGAGVRRALRHAASTLVSEGAPEREDLIHPASACTMHMPFDVRDYTDFYAGIHHAINVGKLFRPDAPLLPNYKWVPIGYHGRASSLTVSGGEVRRPHGQRKSADVADPSFGPCARLDYELEIGIWIGGGNGLGQPVPIAEASSHIAGYCLLNDWSARDLQAWEYQPLGPFLSKSFHTSLSPWVVTPESLAPFRAMQPARPPGDPQPLPHLDDATDQRAGALQVDLEVFLSTTVMRAAGMTPSRLSTGSALNLYWTPAQLVAHHASNGCNLNVGDLLGTGTISAPTPDGYGSLLELSRGGEDVVALPSGETRAFLADGDEVTMHARARREGFAAIGFGACRGRIVAGS